MPDVGLRADQGDPRRVGRQSGRVVRLVRLFLDQPLFRRPVLPQGRRGRPAVADRRHLRRRLHRPAGGRLADGGLCRPRRTPRGADAVGGADERRLLRHRHPADLRPDRGPGAAGPARSAPGPRLLAGRRIRGQRHLHVGDGRGQAPRLLVVLPVHQPDRRPGGGAVRPRHPAACAEQGRPRRLGLAHPLRHRRGAGDRGLLDPHRPRRDSKPTCRSPPRRPSAAARSTSSKPTRASSPSCWC